MTNAMVTSDHDALLRGVLIDPADDLVRLIFADWVEEREESFECPTCRGIGIGFTQMYVGGPMSRELLFNPAKVIAGLTEDSIRSDVLTQGVNPCVRCDSEGVVSNGYADRAEFVRVQIKLAGIRAGDPEPEHYELPGTLGDLRRRERDIWKQPSAGRYFGSVYHLALGRTLFDRCTGPGASGLVRRGFVAEIRLTLADFLARAKELFSAHPIERVVLTDRRPSSETWFNAGPEVDPGRDDRHWLPSCIFGGLPGGMVIAHSPRHREYDSDDAAMSALSAACVAYARQSAGLPPMPEGSAE